MAEPDGGLTHVDESGSARMVDVGAKNVSDRRAVAECVVRMKPETAAVVAAGDLPKGDVVSTARIAGIQAAKRTAELIPLCHPLALSFVDVEVLIDPEAGAVSIRGEARTSAQTGVEMEALTACSVAALTVYDMVKGVERGVVIEQLRLLEKTGGKEDWRAQQ
jgi:cyclic pyranopterin monophosphate synthase